MLYSSHGVNLKTKNEMKWALTGLGRAQHSSNSRAYEFKCYRVTNKPLAFNNTCVREAPVRLHDQFGHAGGTGGEPETTRIRVLRLRVLVDCLVRSKHGQKTLNII